MNFILRAYYMLRQALYYSVLLAAWLPTFLWAWLAWPQGFPMVIVAPLAWVLALRVLAPQLFYLGAYEVVRAFEAYQLTRRYR